MIKYFEASDVKATVEEIVEVLHFVNIKPQYVYCFRSIGSRSKYTIARIHSVGKIWHKALHITPSYIIEVISERYDKLDIDQKEKTIIHELLHIPKGFSGGLLPHKGYIKKQFVDKLHAEMRKKKDK